MKCPCKGCMPPKRNAECHITCTAWIEWKQWQKKNKDRIQRAQYNEANVQAALVKGYRRRVHTKK